MVVKLLLDVFETRPQHIHLRLQLRQTGLRNESMKADCIKESGQGIGQRKRFRKFNNQRIFLINYNQNKLVIYLLDFACFPDMWKVTFQIQEIRELQINV